jgi:hypothetical protein
VTLRSCALAGAVLLVLAASAAAQVVVGYPGPVWSRGAYDASASLKIESKPRETEVYVDGFYAGKVDDFDGALQRLHAEAGDHEISLFLPGYRLFTQQIYLQPRSTFKIHHDMEKLAPGEPEPEKPTGTPRARTTAPVGRGRGRAVPPADRDPAGPPASIAEAYGTLAIRIQPADAEVFVDGMKWNAPANQRLDLRLDTGVHRVEVRRTGYRGYLTEVTIRSGESMPLNVALAKEP